MKQQQIVLVATEFPESAAVDSPGLINRVFKAALTGRAPQNLITGISFEASVLPEKYSSKKCRQQWLWLTFTLPVLSSALAPKFRWNSQLKFPSTKPNSRKDRPRKSATDYPSVNPVLASIPAAFQPQAIASHLEDQESCKQDKHLKLWPQYEYVSLLYHSFCLSLTTQLS